MNINNLKSTTLAIGQILKIPETFSNISDMPSYTSYTVKKGDSLYNIALKFGTTIDEIMKDNGLSTSVLSIGQVLKIRTSEEIDECFGEDYVDTINYQTYTVKSGDSLYKIALRFNTNVSEIMSLNNLKSTLLSIGQILKIPSTSTGTTYIVKKGDNLYNIASKFNTTVDTIKKKNNLTSNVLQIGQTLVI